MENGPLVSIITPVFNTEQYLRDCIESVLNQTYKNWELILIDDCSRDRSSIICKDYADSDSRIKYLKNDVNLGVSKSRNLAIQSSHGEWIAFLDSDDLWEINKLELQMQKASTTSGEFIYGGYYQILECGKIHRKVNTFESIDFEGMLRGSDIGCLTVLIKKNLLMKNQFQDVVHEDFLLWLDILKQSCPRAYSVDKPLARYRLRPNSRSANKIECAKSQWRIYRKHLGLGLPHSVFYFVHYAIRGVLKHQSRKYD
jgi:teichuronic acid biosynthesis glycosyltransferase TuaG